MRGIRKDGGSKQGNMKELIAKMQTYCQFQVHVENKTCDMKVKSSTETQIEKTGPTPLKKFAQPLLYKQKKWRKKTQMERKCTLHVYILSV